MHGDLKASTARQPYPVVAGMEPEDAKDELRRAIRHHRTERSQRLRDEAAEAFAGVVAAIPAVQQASVVVAYAARPTEPGTLPLLELLAARGARVLLPVLGAGLARDWADYTGPDDLRERAPGRPPEPGGPNLGAEVITEADVVIAPALAIDTSGTRLGQGGGWYDRVLKQVRAGVRSVAMVFPEELYDAAERPLPVLKHDMAVDGVATPDGWLPLPAV